MNSDREKEMRKMGDELIKSLPEDLKDSMASVVTQYLGDLFFEKGIKTYPVLINREMFLKSVARLVISIIRTHVTNNNVEDQQKLMVDFLSELEKQSNKMPYYSEAFETPEMMKYVMNKVKEMEKPDYFDRERLFKEQIRRDLFGDD